MLISLNLDVMKITRERLYKGEKGTYLKLTVAVNDQPDQYGNDCSVWEEQTKEEREAKKGRNFLGNGKVVHGKSKTIEAGELPIDNLGDENSDDGTLPF